MVFQHDAGDRTDHARRAVVTVDLHRRPHDGVRVVAHVDRRQLCGGRTARDEGTDRGLRPVADDELLADDAVRAEDALDLELDPLDGERLAVERERAAVAIGIAQQLARDVERSLTCPLRTAQSVDLLRVLPPAPLREQLPVDGDVDPVRPQMVGEL